MPRAVDTWRLVPWTRPDGAETPADSVRPAQRRPQADGVLHRCAPRSPDPGPERQARHVPLVARLVDLVLPHHCVGCGAPTASLCAACLPRGELVHVPLPGLAVLAAAPYADAVRTALLGYKERGRRDLARPLGELLGEAVLGIGLGLPNVAPGARPAALVPVPSSRAAAAARGGDHMVRLSRRAGRSSGHPTLRALTLRRAVADSAGLDTAARAANLGGAMAARSPSVTGRPAVIVDDIVTTGATVHEAARALAAAGWSVVGAAAIAATPRRYPTRR